MPPAIGPDLHSDIAEILLESGSLQINLWGINIHYDKAPAEQIEYDAAINIKPAQGNKSRNVEYESIRAEIALLFSELILQIP